MCKPYKNYFNYLYYGYLPTHEGHDWLFGELNDSINYSYTINEASRKWDELFDNAFSRTGNNEKIIIPLSGGWDSRAILGAALERVNVESIRTISFGAPGQLDYDIGRYISNKLSIKHHSLDLREIRLTYECLLESVKKSPWTYVPDAYFNQIARAYYTDEESSVWIGFLGDDFSGEHLAKIPTSRDESIKRFIKKQRRARSYVLSSNDYNPTDALASLNLDIQWEDDDILDFVIRQINCITPIVTPLKKWQNWDQSVIVERNKKVVLPFLEKDWIQYWLRAPYELRVNRKLYLELLNSKYSSLLRLPTKKHFGASSNRELRYFYYKGLHRAKARIYRRFPRFGISSRATINYLDFNQMFRTRRDYKDTFNSAVQFLKSNSLVPWLDVDSMMQDHLSYKADYGDAFMVLIGFAANMDANVINK